MHRVQVSEAAALLGTEGQLATAFVGAGLTERERMAVILVLGLDIPPGPSESVAWFAKGRTQKEVARLMNISAARSGQLVRGGLEKLGKWLHARGVRDVMRLIPERLEPRWSAIEREVRLMAGNKAFEVPR